MLTITRYLPHGNDCMQEQIPIDATLWICVGDVIEALEFSCEKPVVLESDSIVSVQILKHSWKAASDHKKP
jgi:hypothetical protein